jgi:hypothetical protein
MAFSAFTAGLGAIGITGTAATIGAIALQGGLIGGAVNSIMGGDFGEGFLMGAITGGAEWLVSGALGAIAPSMSALGNAMASSFIVTAGTAALMGQKDWLKQGLIGGAMSGIFYTAVDWGTKAFAKPTGAKPGSLVSDVNGNVFLIDSAGNGQFQPDLFAMADDGSKTVTIFDKAGNVVNSTNQAAKPSPIYEEALARGEIPPKVGLSQVGEIDGVAGTATYYTNGKSTWTPISDDIGFGTTTIIPSDTVIASDVTIDPYGLKTPSVEYTTASGYNGTRDMYQNAVYGKVNVDGVDGNLTYYKFGDETVATFVPDNIYNSYTDVTDTFANKTIIDSSGNVYKDGVITSKNVRSNYIDSSGMVYDSAGNPLGQYASAVDNPNVDWSGTLQDRYIQRTNGDAISTSGKYINGVKQGELAVDMTRSGKYYSGGTYNGQAGSLYDLGDGNVVFRPADLSGDVGFQKANIDIDYRGNIKEIRPSTTVDLTYNGSSVPADAPTITPKQVSSKSVNYDGQYGTLIEYDNNTFTFKPNDRYATAVDVPSSEVIKNAYGGINFDIPVASVGMDGVPLSAKGTRLAGDYSGNYVDAGGIVYDDIGNPVSKLQGAKAGVDYSGTLYNGKIYTPDNMVVDIATGAKTKGPNYTVVYQADLPDYDNIINKPKIGSVDPYGNAYDQFDQNLNKSFAGNYVDQSGYVYDDLGNPIVQLEGAVKNPNVDWSGTLSGDGYINRTNGDTLFAENGKFVTGSLAGQDALPNKYSTPEAIKASAPAPVKPTPPEVPAQPAQPSQPAPDSYKVGSRGEIYDANGTQIGQIKSAASNPNMDYSGTLTKDGIITRSDGSAINTQGTVVKPAPTQPTPSYVDSSGMGYDAMGNPVGQATPGTATQPPQYTQPVNVAPVTNNLPTGFTQAQVDRLMNTTAARTGNFDINGVNQFVAQGYTPEQIIRAVENSPNGGWGGYTTGVRSMNPGAAVASAPTVPTPDVSTTPKPSTTPDVPATPTQPQTTQPLPDSYKVGSRGEIYDAAGNQIGQIKSAASNPNVDYSGNLTKDGIISRADGSAINTQGTLVRPATPVPEIPTTPVDTTPTQPIVPQEPDVIEDIINNYRPTPDLPPVDTTPTRPVDTTPTRPVDTTPTAPVSPVDITPPPVVEVDVRTPSVGDFTPPANQPYVDLNGNFVNSDGTLQGNNYQNNYVDRSGVVYDDFGNPAGRLVSATDPTVNYEGILQGNGAIKTPAGTYLDTRFNNPNPPAPVDTTPTQPPVDHSSSYTGPPKPTSTDPNSGSSYNQPINTPTTTPDLPGYNYVDSSGVMYDQYGNPSKDLSGNYVDKDGIVYDEFGNPAGDLTPGQNIKPGTDLSGTLNNNGTITKPDGSVIDYNGNTIKPPGTVTPDKPVTPDTPINPAGPGTIGAVITNVSNMPTTPTTTGKGYTLNWGTPPTINLPGVNPGTYAQAVKPYYTNVTEIQPQYYWGKHPYAATEADLANYNNIPGAPAQPFGAQFSAVGGNRRMDVNQFIQDYLDPQYQAGYIGSQPQFAGIAGTRSPIQAAPMANSINRSLPPEAMTQEQADYYLSSEYPELQTYNMSLYPGSPMPRTNLVNGPIAPTAMPAQTRTQAAPAFATPARMAVNTGIGSLPPVSIPTWTKEGGLYYAVPTAAAV